MFDAEVGAQLIKRVPAAGAVLAQAEQAVGELFPARHAPLFLNQWRTILRSSDQWRTLARHPHPTGAACRRTGHRACYQVPTRPPYGGYGPGSACASACRLMRHPADAAWRSSRRWRSRSSPKPAATAQRSPTVRRIRNRSGGSISRRTRTDGRDGLPTGACPALALRAFIPSIRLLDGSILLRRTVLHSRSEPPGTSLRPAKAL